MKYVNGTVEFTYVGEDITANYAYNFYAADATLQKTLCLVRISITTTGGVFNSSLYLVTNSAVGELNTVKYSLTIRSVGNVTAPVWDFENTNGQTSSKTLKAMNVNAINCNNQYGSMNRLGFGTENPDGSNKHQITDVRTNLPYYHYVYNGSNMPEDTCARWKADMLRYFVNGDTSTAENSDDLGGNHIDFNLYYNINTRSLTMTTAVRSGESEPPYSFIYRIAKGAPDPLSIRAFDDRYETTLDSIGYDNQFSTLVGAMSHFSSEEDNPWIVYCNIAGRAYEGDEPVQVTRGISSNGKYRLIVNYGDPPNEYYPTNDDYSDDVDENNNFSGTSALTKTYMCNEQQIQALGNDLWTGSFFDKVQKLFTSPMENIVSVKAIPAEQKGTETQIMIGNYQSTQKGVLSKNVVKFEKVAQGSIIAKYNNFLDLSPYTQALVFLPFIGFVNIDISTYWNAPIAIDAVIDFVTGAIEYIFKIKKDGTWKPIQTESGNCGVDIPLSSTNRSQLESSLLNKAIKGGISFKNIYDTAVDRFTATQHTATTGSPSPTVTSKMPSDIFIVYVRPDAYLPTTYGHQYGHLWKITSKVGNLSGYTILENPDLSGIDNLLEPEKEKLRQILTSGFFA